MIKHFCTVFLILGLGFFSGCVTTVDAVYSAKAGEYSIGSVFVLKSADSSEEMDKAIVRELNRLKISATVGSDESKATEEDAILKYNENWKTGVARSLESLEILLFDRSGKMIAKSFWKNSKVNSLSPLGLIVRDSLSILFETVKIRPPKTS